MWNQIPEAAEIFLRLALASDGDAPKTNAPTTPHIQKTDLAWFLRRASAAGLGQYGRLLPQRTNKTSPTSEHRNSNFSCSVFQTLY
jgi:hypothetical protein